MPILQEESGNLKDIEIPKYLLKYGLLTKCEVKMAGYWPSAFFCVFMDRYEVEVHKLAIKEQGQYPATMTKQTW